MRKFKLIGGTVLTPIRALAGAEVAVEEGKIVSVGPRDAATDAGADILDAGGCFVAPGFIDMHVHGGGGYDFMDATVEAFHGAARMHALHGTATLLPTSLASGDEALLAMIAAYREAVRAPWQGAAMPGLHLEGPYFSPSQAGAQEPGAIAPPDPRRTARILAAAQGSVLRWSSAPELPGSMEFAREMRERGILLSIGHSDAREEVVAEAIENGYSHLTHFYSCMSTIVREKSYRFAGIIECGYLYPELTVELIADGRHLPASLLRLAYQSMGTRRVALVTDALRGAGMPEGESVIGSLKEGRKCIIEDGVAKLPDRSAFAGSVATADRLVRNMVRMAGAPLLDAVKMMSLTPARIMGFRDRGILAPGYRADIVCLDADLRAVKTFVGGEMVKN
ncbi:MAG TPA: N-acetylglucosamine-6-phosphate deacetylase [Candidatus Alectryocaccomicrobium excrementavium]|uniref:N-acetylglucosamine-6-phosphate deacetylase n=1 Tax=Candidatus Alectryocaccomicrobium excrementavium TaxID=2840668 RepID=A0A9D1FYT1_9FIRM|nr:N-acetylglucosamine-6-phosphate deacetylase [Candidatus Alectryocaccomicrobium excrementavium]